MSLHLSKSKYMAGCQCSKRVWLSCRSPTLGSEVGAAKQAIFDLGHEVGNRAHELFPGGVLVDEEPSAHERAVARTQRLMERASVPAIFEAAFEHEGVRIRVDVLERLSGGRWGLREVKASTRVKPEHTPDCAVQRFVLEGCGLQVGSIELVHVNREFVRGGGDHRLAALFHTHRLDRGGRAASCRGWRSELRNFEPLSRTTPSRPSNPRSTALLPMTASSGSTARASEPDDWAFHLPGMNAKKHAALRDEGVVRISEIPDDFPLTEIQGRVRNVLRSGQPFVCPDLRRGLTGSGPPAVYPRLRDDESGDSALSRDPPVRANSLPVVAAPRGFQQRGRVIPSSSPRAEPIRGASLQRPCSPRWKRPERAFRFWCTQASRNP